MNSTLKQDPRVAKLDTPFGKDVLALVRFDGTESLSDLFEFRIEALGKGEDVDFDKAIGRPCSVTFYIYGNERAFNGILVEAEWLGKGDTNLHSYRLVLRPWLWLLSRTSDCRIFEDKTAPEIIKSVFSDRGFSDFRDGLTENYPKLEYCVQYRETDLNFALRLMEQHGIYYFFEHSTDKHLLVLADAESSHKPVPACSTMPFNAYGGGGHENREHVSHWLHQRRFRTGKIEYNDYNYLQPTANLISDAKGSAHYTRSDMELYDYPGKYKNRKDGETYAKVQLQAEQALDERRHATGIAASLFPGGLVSLEKHPKGSENTKYLVVRSSHSISVEPYRSAGPALSEEDVYSGSYELQPCNRPFRSPIVTPKPRIYGIQTAKVVGKQGEEIDVDEYGRVMLEFFWDRKKKQSCRVRVAEVWSGKKWGGQFIPRIGMEAVVEFLEGDPDRPLVVGTVYNKDYRHPFELPANKTQSGLKSDSSKGGSGYNQVMFEDKKGNEEIKVHAQKDYKLKVIDTEVREIGEHYTGQAAGPNSRKTTLVQGSDELTVAGGNQDVTIAMNQNVKVGVDQTNTIGLGQTTTTGGPIAITAGLSITLTCGASLIEITPAGIFINAPVIAMSSVGPLWINGMPVIISGPTGGAVY
jgi:type VI secretion system secreted protein VgrG